MTSLMLATDSDGHAIEVQPASVRALAPVEHAPDRTTLFLDDKAVTVDGQYETLIAEFAAMWPMHAL